MELTDLIKTRDECQAKMAETMRTMVDACNAFAVEQGVPAPVPTVEVNVLKHFSAHGPLQTLVLVDLKIGLDVAL